ncbi:putative glycosidase [Dioscorea sansibarensis]
MLSKAKFSSLKVRLGGTLQDKVIYDIGNAGEPCTSFVKNSSEMFGFTQGCLPQSRWDELNHFFRKTGAAVVFGLNSLNGRVPLQDGSVGGPWNSTNAAALIRYTVKKGYKIHGWELGNELSGNGIGTRISADQYAADVINLKSIVNELYKNSTVKKPLVIAPGGFFDADWFGKLINQTKANSLDAVSHHIYNLGPGVDEHLIDKILDPKYLDGEESVFSNLQSILRSSGSSAKAWVGEAGGAYNSGRNLVTNSFVFSFWYLDQLGMASKYDTKTYCRQSLIGGNYGLLNTTTFKPNPDYYSALLWHRLMGRKVLETRFNSTNKIRAYVHCARKSKGITVLLINLEGNRTSQVYITSREFHSKKVSELGKKRTSFHHHKIPRASRHMRYEYHLTAKDAKLQSQTMLLNNNTLEVDSNGNIPKLKPIEVKSHKPITIKPFSIVFAHIPYFHAPACK